MAKNKKENITGEDRSIRKVARHEYIRTGRKRPGSLLRAFNLKYPNRPYSERIGPNFEED
jgi:hypothetical protein